MLPNVNCFDIIQIMLLSRMPDADLKTLIQIHLLFNWPMILATRGFLTSTFESRSLDTHNTLDNVDIWDEITDRRAWYAKKQCVFIDISPPKNFRRLVAKAIKEGFRSYF